MWNVFFYTQGTLIYVEEGEDVTSLAMFKTAINPIMQWVWLMDEPKVISAIVWNLFP